MEATKTVTLRNGVEMPLEGFGVLLLKDFELCKSFVLEALKDGYRLIDTAAAYFNEEAVGAAVKESGIPREEIFLTSKLWMQDFGYEETREALAQTLERMQVDYLDLYLIHHPLGDYYNAWRALEDLYGEGKIRAIGVSNFDQARLADLCMNSNIAPMVNQIEIHPFHQQEKQLQVMKEYQVQPQAWAPLCEGQKMIFQNKVLMKLAKKYGKSPAQIILRWNIQRGVAVIPGSSDVEHIKENQDIWDFKITKGDMALIGELDTGVSEIIDHQSAFTVKWLNGWKIHD